MTKIEFPRHPVAFLAYFFQSLTVGQKTSIYVLAVITVTVVISNIVLMHGFQLLVDGIAKADAQNAWGTLAKPFWIIVGCCVFHTVMYRVRDVVDACSTPHVMNGLREMLMTNITRHSHDYFHNRFSGELVNKVNNLTTIYHTILWDRGLHGFIPAITGIIASAVLVGLADVYLSVIMLTVVVGTILAVYFLGKYMGRASANLADREADISGQLVDTITNISSVKNFAQHGHELFLLKRYQIPYVSAYQRHAKWQIVFWGIFDVFLSSMVIGLVWYLIQNYSRGHLSAGQVAVAMIVAWDMWTRMAFFSWHLAQVTGDFGKMQSALNEFVRPVSVEDVSNATVFMPDDGRIEFKDVSFTYDDGHRVFDQFNLVIPASQKVGVVGLSGAGKTTLCQLLLRNYDIHSGEIIVGGQDIAKVQQESLRKNIAVIPQDPTLFHRSLYENILYGKPDATKEEVYAAAKAAQAHDFILRTQQGYETEVGERGVKLSGGQRQRIAIARAILKNAPVLILDEATSALDSDTERLIQAALDTAMEGRTTIVVAHRLSTLAHLDRIIVMKDGLIIEDGNLQSLIAQNGHFAYLWNLQAGGFLPEKL